MLSHAENLLNEEIHIWDFPKNTTIKLNPNFLNEINLSIKKNFIRKKKVGTILQLLRATSLNIRFTTFKSYLKPSLPTFRDLHVLLKVCECLEIPKEELEKNVIAYQFKKSRITIQNPIMPIIISPLFPMIVGHMIADGNIVRFKNKSSIYFSYRQYDSQTRMRFLQKLENIFGNIDYPNNYFVEETRIYVPEVLTRIISDYYSMNSTSFLSKSAVLPEKIMISSPKHLLAVLIAFIIDEGYIDSAEIVIALKNQPLILQLSEICNKLGYANTWKKSNKYGMARLYILQQGVKNFWIDYQQLKEQFDCIALGHREEKLESNILRFNKDWKSRGQNQTKNVIIVNLKEKPATILELAQQLNISRQGIRNHVNELYLSGIVDRCAVKESAHCYSLKKEIRFLESNKGRSMPIGKTESEIKNLLLEPITTTELYKKINLDKSDLRLILNRLHAKGEIKLLGKKHTGTMPTKIWQLNF